MEEDQIITVLIIMYVKNNTLSPTKSPISTVALGKIPDHQG
jgi:hypothetical protein